MWKKIKAHMNETIEVRPNIGRFKVHPMVFYQIAPSMAGENKKLDVWLEAIHSIYNDSLLKHIREGQEAFSFELYGKDKRYSYYFGFPERHADFLAERCRYVFKGSGIELVSQPPGLSTNSDVSVYELTLSRAAFQALRLKTEGEFTSQIVNVFEGLRIGEELWVQVLLEPLDTTWTDNIKSQYHAYLDGEETLQGVGVATLLAKGLKTLTDIPREMAADMVGQRPVIQRKPKELKHTEVKLRQKGFRVNVRVAIRAVDRRRRDNLQSSVLNAFRTMNEDNEWKTRTPLSSMNTLLKMNQRRLSPFDYTTLLCHDEVRAFFYMPTKEMETERLVQMTPDEVKPDERLTQGGIHIGYTVTFQKIGEKVYISCKEVDDAAKVRLWVASPGGGKSTQIETFADEAAKLGHGFCIYDAKDGVLFHRMLATLSRDHDENRFVILNYENEERPPIFNFNALGAEGQSAGSMFVELFELLFNGKDLTTSKSFAVKCAHSVFSDPNSTFLEFILMMRDNDFRKKFLPQLRHRNPDLYLWWKTEFPKISEDEVNRMCRPILDRMENGILYNSRMSNILCGRGGKIAYRKWMDEGKMVLVNAPLGFFTEPELRFLMALHNFASWNATLSRRSITQTGKRARLFHLIFDEPQNYMDATPTIQTAIAKARAYSVSYNFFIQEAEQIIEKAPSLWKCIMGMSPMMMVGPVSEFTAKQVRAELGVSVEEILKLKELPYHWYYKGYVDKAAVPATIIHAVTPIDKRTPPIPLVDRSKLVEKQAAIYGPYTAQEIQEDISARNFKLSVEEYRKLIASYDYEEEEGVLWED